MLISQLSHGGAERQTTILLEHLSSQFGIRPLVCCLSSILEPFGERIRKAGCEIVYIQRHKSFESRRVLFLRRLLKDRAIRLLHAIHYQAIPYGWLASRGIKDLSFIPSIRSTVYDPGFRKRAFFRWVLPRCDFLIVNSTSGSRWLHQFFGVSEEKIHIVPNGLDPALLSLQPRRQAIRGQLGLPSEAPLIAFVGRAKGHKGVPLLYQIFRRVLEVKADAQLIMIGSGLTQEWVQATFGAHPGVHGLGTREDVYDLIGAADCLLLTSTTEGFPNAVLEAMVLGVPPVATTVGECPLLIDHGEDGFLFEYGDDLAGAQSVLQLLSDPLLRSTMSKRVRDKSAMRYGTAAMAAATLQVYEKALGRTLLPPDPPSRLS